MATTITPPVFAFDEVDLTIFTGERELLYDLGLELQDVERGEYHCYDAEGFEVVLYVVRGGNGKELIAKRGEHKPFEFRSELDERLRRLGKSPSGSESLAELRERAIATFDVV